MLYGPAVDRLGLQAHHLGDTQTRRVTGGQDHAMPQTFHRVQELANFRLTQHVWQSIGLPAGGDVVRACSIGTAMLKSQNYREAV